MWLIFFFNFFFRTRKKVPDYFHPSISLNSHLFALSLDAKLLFTGGHWDSSLQVYSIPKNKVISSVISHFGWYLRTKVE